ncbi:MAG: preprotein translocase subunit YajC [Thermoleophilia bacterium]|jgi:preprotein translocase subunit YajC|nr:preprotein translocase subunit YajC [Thermoleophilia bacterium]
MANGGVLLIWILVFFGIFYFLAIRPQRRQKQAHREMVSMMKRGDEVVTIGGMFGTVRKIGDDWIELEVGRGTRVRFLKRAISSIVSEEDEEEEEYVGDEEYDEDLELEAGADDEGDEELVADDEADEELVADDELVVDEEEPGADEEGEGQKA